MRKVITIMLFHAALAILAADDVKKSIDDAFLSGSQDMLESIIQAESRSENWNENEAYLIEKVKSKIIAGDYTFSRNILNLILLNNPENMEAQDIYISLEKEEKARRLEEQKKLEQEARAAEEERRKKEEEDKKRDEEERKRKAEEERLLEEQRIREENEKLKEIAKTLEEEVKNTPQVIITREPDNFFSFYGELGPADFIMYSSGFFSDVYGRDKTSYRYGMSAAAGIGYDSPSLTAFLDLYADYFFIEIRPESASVFSWKIIASTAPFSFSMPLYLRLGWVQTSYSYPSGVGEDMYITNLFSPVFGAGLREQPLVRNLEFDLYFDFYIISFMTSLFDGAFDTGAALKYDLPDFRKFDLYLKTGISGTFVMGDNNMENNLKFILAAGVEAGNGKEK